MPIVVLEVGRLEVYNTPFKVYPNGIYSMVEKEEEGLDQTVEGVCEIYSNR